MTTTLFPAGTYEIGDPSRLLDEKLFEQVSENKYEVQTIENQFLFKCSYGGGLWKIGEEAFGEDTGGIVIAPLSLTIPDGEIHEKRIDFKWPFQVKSDSDSRFVEISWTNADSKEEERLHLLLNQSDLPEDKYFLGDPSLALSPENWTIFAQDADLNGDAVIEVLQDQLVSRMIFEAAEHKKNWQQKDQLEIVYDLPSGQIALLPEKLVVNSSHGIWIPETSQPSFFEEETSGNLVVQNERGKIVSTLQIL